MVAGDTSGIFAEDFLQCRSGCLDNRYGDAYDFAVELNPLTVSGVAVDQAVKWADSTAVRSISQNRYADSVNLPLGRSSAAAALQSRLLYGLRTVNASSALLGAGALGFMGGANGYCAVECMGRR